ncbi:MAG: (d)CMP kinase [Prolixibacteraceae bacterium]|nr:(d)CMP kinase [Prolixibacteraceae bacterium]
MGKIIIAIDGHSSCGKSTMAKMLAKELGYLYLDSGAMYRAVTLYALRNNLIDKGKLIYDKLIEQLPKIKIGFNKNLKTGKSETYLNEENVEDEIRQLPVSNFVSSIATVAEVRKRMVKQQQLFGKDKGIVMDGRDISTIVFPDAELKIFMTALPEIRAQRRFDELKKKGSSVNFEEILKNVKDRDKQDTNRKISPLKIAPEAIILDNSYLTRQEQLTWVLEKANKIIKENEC